MKEEIKTYLTSKGVEWEEVSSASGLFALESRLKGGEGRTME
jgi:hypothetical protein